MSGIAQPIASPTSPVTLESLLGMSRLRAAQRLVLTGMFLSLVWKWSFFVAADRVYRMLPIRDEFFPGPLQWQGTLRVAFLGALVAIVVSFFTSRRPLRVIAGWSLWGAATVLCLHQGTYNDMTFATVWWTSLWSLWFAYRLEDAEPAETLRRAALLSRLILSMILLGGAIGKWTPEYWSGEVFYEIYFVDRDFWVFNRLREWFDAETLRTLAKWYSRKVVVIETLGGIGLWVLPARWAAVVGAVLFASIALFSNFLLFSVLSCLIALALVGLLVSGRGTSAPGRVPSSA